MGGVSFLVVQPVRTGLQRLALVGVRSLYELAKGLLHKEIVTITTVIISIKADGRQSSPQPS